MQDLKDIMGRQLILGHTFTDLREQKDFIGQGNIKDVEVQYVQDCFEDLERPKFGWRVKVTLAEKETCDITLKDQNQVPCKVDSISNGKFGSNYYSQRRQSGDGLISATAPNCNVEYVCDSLPN